MRDFLDFIAFTWSRPIHGAPIWAWLTLFVLIAGAAAAIIGTVLGFDMTTGRCNSYGDCLYEW